MKKLIGISLFSVSLIFVSCQKEQIKMTDSQVSAPEWKETRSLKTSTPGSDLTSTTVTGTGITDPNNDPDMNAKKVIKQ